MYFNFFHVAPVPENIVPLKESGAFLDRIFRVRTVPLYKVSRRVVKGLVILIHRPVFNQPFS